ncbi:alpha-glucan water dikinase 2 isoform X1 [Senna tora]|uniref:Alpha-glucan water dikinase 2 isoform X1 n=1 Tax=Senna tora TaxID=362788 RepID=A0A834T9Y1_9FABA|nr:alpha-glucan water dikinase 2 isoform X1 [Senna tora]
MASSSATNSVQVPRLYHFDLIEGMQLEINISGSSERRNVRIEFQLKNCTRAWILHWGFVFHGNKNWFIAADDSSGGKIYKHGALQSQFVKHGQIYLFIIELRDPKIQAIEFVLKDGPHDRWLKLNHGNFRIEIPASDVPIHHSSIPKHPVENKPSSSWESKDRPIISPHQQKRVNHNTLKELVSRLAKGTSLNVSQSSYLTGSMKPVNGDRDPVKSVITYSYKGRYNVEEWLQKQSDGYPQRSNESTSALVDLIERFMGGTDILSWQRYCVHNHEILVFSKIISGDYHIFISSNTKGATILHWGVSKSSPCEWLVPPVEIWPENSKLVSGACQSNFIDKFTGNGSFQVVDVNLQSRNFVGIQFVIWTGGFWIKNNGANFFAGLKQNNPSGRFSQDTKEFVIWLLDEISQREKEAERSLMHRFNIATELTERSRNEGGLGLIGILVWLRFMACRHLTWNKNYNVKPREISEALDRFTNLLQRIYLNHPNDREMVRLIMACVGRGGSGDVGQRIRDEILLILRNNDLKTGMMEEWHQKLHNNSSPDDVIICEALINYVRSGFRINAYWESLNANGLTREKLASYDRPIVSEPHFKADLRDGLIRDLTAYLKTLKAVHAGIDLETAIDFCLGSIKDGKVENAIKSGSAAGLPSKLMFSGYRISRR